MRQTGLLLLLACSLLSCRRFAEGFAEGLKGETKAAAKAEAIDQSYVSKNGLITVHYPGSFAAKTVGQSVVVLAKNLGDGTDEAVTFASVDQPISDEVGEFARVVDHATVEKLGQYAEKMKKPATCNGQPGVETYGTWVTEQGGIRISRRACYFLRDGHGYSFAFSVPENHEAEQEPILQKILDATEFHH